MTPAFTLSAASDDLYEAVFALHEKVFRAHIEQIWGWHEDWQRKNFHGNWNGCDTRVIGRGGEVIGYMQMLQCSDHILLKNLGILPAHQNMGIGGSLVRDLQARAAGLGLPVRLAVFVTNPGAQLFYERMGFVNESRSKEFQEMMWSGAQGEPIGSIIHDQQTVNIPVSEA